MLWLWVSWELWVLDLCVSRRGETPRQYELFVDSVNLAFPKSQQWCRDRSAKEDCRTKTPSRSKLFKCFGFGACHGSVTGNDLRAFFCQLVSFIPVNQIKYWSMFRDTVGTYESISSRRLGRKKKTCYYSQVPRILPKELQMKESKETRAKSATNQ